MTKLRIVFMGTPEFAVASLDRLVTDGYEVVGVITAPDRPSGRGQKVSVSAVKQYALEHELPLLQPTNLKSAAFLEELAALRADLQIVVAFRMLPEVVWDMPPKGTVNLHASLLPQYRGAAPINWVVMNGETRTGVTTFFIRHEIDTGDLLLQREIPIGPDETAGELHNKLMESGAELVLETVRAIEQHTVEPIPQVVSGTLKKAPKIFREDTRIDWSRPTQEVYNHIRGLSPYPAAYTELHGKMLKVYRAAITLTDHGIPSGNCRLAEGNLRYYTPDGFLDILEVQLEGKKRMNAEAFLRGYTWPEA